MLNCSGNTVCGNIIGMNYDGASAIRNSSSGFTATIVDQLIGLASGVRNLISGNGQQGSACTRAMTGGAEQCDRPHGP